MIGLFANDNVNDPKLRRGVALIISYKLLIFHYLYFDLTFYLNRKKIRNIIFCKRTYL